MTNPNPACRIRFEPSGLRTEVPPGATLLEAARLAGVYVSAICGGDGTCGKCKVVVTEGRVDAPPTPLLTAEELRAGTVLACQAALLSDATVAVPVEHRLDTGHILTGHDSSRAPAARPDAATAEYVVAVDVGTTTVVAHLLDAASETTLDAEACYNSQMHFGDDYIRRIMYAEEHGAFDEMQRRIAGDINGLVRALVARHGIPPERLGAIYAAGNTAMIYFLLGRADLLPEIRRGRPMPEVVHTVEARAADLGIGIAPEGRLVALPSVGAYVGADIVAGVLETRLHEAEAPALLIDIGTNGEIVLGSREWMVSASSSAGPAFEGSGIRCGMRAAAGAIERFHVGPDGTFHWHAAGGQLPRGLCGSGLLDLLASFFEAGIIDRTGRFAHPDDPRFGDGPDGPEFTIVPPAGARPAIVITQADIANLIRSKAGVYAAISTLMESTGARLQDIETVYVAGGFGDHLDPEKAILIGLLPDVPVDKVLFVGNTSIAGAKRAAMSRAALAEAEAIASRMTYFDLMNHPGYMEAFIQANFLPHTDLERFPTVRERLKGR